MEWLALIHTNMDRHKTIEFHKNVATPTLFIFSIKGVKITDDGRMDVINSHSKGTYLEKFHEWDQMQLVIYFKFKIYFILSYFNNLKLLSLSSSITLY